MRSFFLSIALLASTLIACSPRHVSINEEISAAQNTSAWIQREFGLIESPEASRLLERVSAKLSTTIYRAALETELSRCKVNRVEQFPWQVFVVNSNFPHAFSPGAGLIFLTKGLMKQLGSEAELASVISHEMAHNLLEHTSQLIAAGLQSEDSPRYYLSLSNELEADLLGLKMLQIARYDLRHAVTPLIIHYRPLEGTVNSLPPEWLVKRVAALQQEIVRYGRQLAATENTREFNRVRSRL